jgi:predicted DNA-binding transcriptional regulator AlpA
VRLLDKKEVGALVGYHPESVMRLVREGGFPPPVKMGDRPGCAVRWIADEIDEWIRERMAARLA